MIRTRSRKILRDVWSRKGRTALVSLAIFVGVLGTIALFSMSDIIVRQLRADVREEALPMLSIFVTVSSDLQPGNDEAYLEQLRQLPGVTEVQGGVSVLAQFKDDPEETEEFTDAFIYAFSVPYESGLTLMPMRLLSGTYPRAGANEVILEKRTAEKYDFEVGDPIYFRILSPSRETGEIGTTEEWRVSGIVFHPYMGATGNFGSVPTEAFYGLKDDANYIGGGQGYQVFDIRFTEFETAEGQGQDERAANFIADETPYIPVFIQFQDPAQNQLIQTAQTLGSTMSFLALVALIVSGFLVVNVITSIVVEQKKQIGIMKSMGASGFDNLFMYSGIAFCYGMIAVIPGVILGIPAGNAAAHALAPQLNTVLEGFQTSMGSIILGILVGLLVPVLASLMPVFFGTRVNILQALTDLGIDVNYGSGPLARFISILPLPVTIRQGLSNVSIKKGRLIFTVLTLAIAVGAFMGIFSVFNSLTTGIDIFLDSFNVEIGVFPNQTQDPDKMIAVLSDNFMQGENPILQSIEPGFQLQVEFEGYEPPPTTGGPPGIFAYGYDVNSETPAFNFTVDEGELLTDENAGDGIIFSDVLAAHMDKQLGDTVVMKVPGNTTELTIVGISKYPLDQVWLDWRTLATIAGYTAAGEVTSPLPIPEDTAAFMRYLTMVNVGDVEVTAAGFTTDAMGFFGSFVSQGQVPDTDQPGVLISSGLAEAGGYVVGDTLTLTGTAEDASTTEYTVTGILDFPEAMQSADLPANFIGMIWQDLVKLDGVSLEGKPIPGGYFLTTTLDNPTSDELKPIIEDVNNVLLDQGLTSFNFNFVELVEQISEAFFIIQAILQAVALLIALVGALGLLTTLSISVFERQKEIGVMRSIGAGSWTVATQFLTEGIVIGIIAWLVGLPIAYVIEVVLLSVTGFDETFPATFPVTAVILGLVGMLVITFVASILPSLAASRKTVSDILRYQ